MNLMSPRARLRFRLLFVAISLSSLRCRGSGERSRPAGEWLRRWPPVAGAAVGALMFAFSTTLWQAVDRGGYAPNAFMVGLTWC
jgi:hypothetical protein